MEGHDPDLPPSLGMSRRLSGIDFDDVFGGPPARSADSFSSSGWEAADPLRPSFGERPVFGESYSPSSSRRKGLGEDFFSDIFKAGGPSGSSTPRRGLDWDSLSSAPTSGVLSPAQHPAPPRTEPVPGNFLLSPLSVAQRVEQARGSPTSVSSPDNAWRFIENGDLYADIHIPRSESDVSASQADQPTVPDHSLHQRDLSFRVFQGEDTSASPETDADASIGTEGYLDQEATNLKDSKGSNRFHFSIYKWASKGVILTVPSSPKEKKTRVRLTGLPMPLLHGVDLPLNRKNLPSGDRVFPSEFDRADVQVYRGSKSAREFTGSKKRVSHGTTNPNSGPAETGVPIESHAAPDIGDISCSGNTAPELVQEQGVPTLKKLLHLLKEHTGEKVRNEDDEPTEKLKSSLHRTASARISDRTGKTEKQSVKKLAVNHIDTEERKIERPHGRTKGSVMNFVQKFNQDASGEPKNIPEPQSWSVRTKDLVKTAMPDHDLPDISKFDVEEKSELSCKGETFPNKPLIGGFENVENLTFDSSSEVERMDKYCCEKNEAAIPCEESTLENVEILYGDMEGSYFEVEECMVEEVVFELQDHDDLLQPSSEVDEFQSSDAKIRVWSAGKEGNIRSLLSTLQYVLWPGSGWKVVPLVDLIEGSSVRRVYQKALLCLHPDKLQQRGAPEHQKYLAEKVFDILQEAWNDFSSVSSI